MAEKRMTVKDCMDRIEHLELVIVALQGEIKNLKSQLVTNVTTQQTSVATKEPQVTEENMWVVGNIKYDLTTGNLHIGACSKAKWWAIKKAADDAGAKYNKDLKCQVFPTIADGCYFMEKQEKLYEEYMSKAK